MSAKDDEMTTLTPKSCSAHGACSREIIAGDDDLRLGVRLAVEDEFAGIVALGIGAQLVEQPLAEAGARNRFQELLGDDLVGVDVDHRQRRGNAGDFAEFFHVRSSYRFSTRQFAMMSCNACLCRVNAAITKPANKISADRYLAQ